MKFEHSYKTCWHDTDARRRVRPTQLLVYMQETSNRHMASLGKSLDGIRDEYGLAFLLSKTRLAVYKPLYAYEDIDVSTWTAPSRGLSFNRFFTIKRGNELIAAADTTWALLHLHEHRLCRSDEFDFGFIDDDPIDIGIPARFRVPKTEELSLLGERRIVYSDLDYNMHMNNTKYADMLCDFLPFDSTESIKGISMSYLHEATFGHTLRVLGTANAEGTKYSFRTLSEDGTTCLEAEIIV